MFAGPASCSLRPRLDSRCSSALCAPEFVGAEEAADGVPDSVFLAGPEVAEDIEGDLGGLVAEGGLDLLHAALTEESGARVCGKCGRSIAGGLVYELIEFNVH